jgi:stearoyl-CoA desaturase (delta-9 desaturase)
MKQEKTQAQAVPGRARQPKPKRPVVWGNVAFLTLLPLATVVAVPWYALTRGVGWVEIAACLGMWVVTGLSVTAGYHRLFAHRAYDAPAAVRAVFAVVGAGAYENSVISWAAAHRYHHRHVDTDDDPYNAQEGFWYSHMGWIMIEGPKHDDTANVPDLWKDPILRWQHRHAVAIGTVFNLATTVVLGLLTGRMLGMFVFALLLRLVLTQHFTFLINSAAHMWGSQPYSSAHSARDNWLLSFFTFGEGYHNYHHSFQADYRNGPRLYNWDPSKWLIWVLARLGLASHLRRSPLDVTLGRMFEHARASFEEHLRGAGETIDGWQASAGETMDGWQASAGETIDGWQASARAHTTAAGAAFRELLASAPPEALRAHIVAAEKRCEEALQDLKTARTSLQRLVSEGASLVTRRRLRRRLREAQRAVRAALEHWQALGRAYLEQLLSAPSAAA